MDTCPNGHLSEWSLAQMCVLSRDIFVDIELLYRLNSIMKKISIV